MPGEELQQGKLSGSVTSLEKLSINDFLSIVTDP
jgi:hypothetical protein